jgi:hypothetical protein
VLGRHGLRLALYFHGDGVVLSVNLIGRNSNEDLI